MNAVASSNALLCDHGLSRLTFFCFFFVFAGSSAASGLGRGRPCIGPSCRSLANNGFVKSSEVHGEQQILTTLSSS